jgi:membrane dipeptidase
MRIVKRVLKGLLILVMVVGVCIVLRIAAGLLLQQAPPIRTAEDQALQARAVELHHDALLVDGHNDLPTWILHYGFDIGMDGNEPSDRDPFIHYGLPWLPGSPSGNDIHTHTDLARIREGGLDAQFFSIWVACSYYEASNPGRARQQAIDMIEALRSQVRRYPDVIEFAYTVSDVERIVSEGRLAALMGLEGGHAIEDDLENLLHFHEQGIRYMTLTHNCSHGWAGSSSDSHDSGVVDLGLSAFGREAVREMNSLGMIVDVSHVSDDTFWDVLEVTRAPIMASHSSARALADHPRNLTDEMLRAVADNGGVVMINFSTLYLDREKIPAWKVFSGWHWFTHPSGPETPLSMLVDHIDHLANVAGIDHVGLGSDFDGVPTLPEGLKDVGDFPNITVELVRRGYSDEDVRKVLGGNVLRVLDAVESVSAQAANRSNSDRPDTRGAR